MSWQSELIVGTLLIAGTSLFWIGFLLKLHQGRGHGPAPEWERENLDVIPCRACSFAWCKSAAMHLHEMDTDVEA